jgi:hypothetical protein
MRMLNTTQRITAASPRPPSASSIPAHCSHHIASVLLRLTCSRDDFGSSRYSLYLTQRSLHTLSEAYCIQKIESMPADEARVRNRCGKRQRMPIAIRTQTLRAMKARISIGKNVSHQLYTQTLSNMDAQHRSGACADVRA